MKAIKTPFYETDRTELGPILPLNAPWKVGIEVSSLCDLRCKFCTFSNPEALKKREHVSKNMSWETFEMIMQQAKAFQGKSIRKSGKTFTKFFFIGLGEVLMNPLTPDMIRVAKESNLAEYVETYTNGVRLTENTALALVDAGLDRLTISINGLDAKDYVKFTGTEIDYEQYYHQIKFLYQHKKQLRISLKTTDAVADTPEKEKKFYDMYGDYCDRINIETIAPFHAGAVLNGTSGAYNRHGDFFDKNRAERCSLPFYGIFVFSDGRINFCDPIMNPVKGLNIYQQSLSEIWLGDVHKQYLLDHLTGKEENYPEMCRGCNRKYCVLGLPEEQIDAYASMIREKLLNVNKGR